VADLQAVKDPLMDTSWLLAIDPLDQRHVWKVRTATGGNGGVLTTGGGLVFQGEGNGRFDAYDGRNGSILWSFDTQVGVVAAPITYSAGGKQFVTLSAGVGTGAAFLPAERAGIVDYRTQPKRLLTFALGANGSLPPASTVLPTPPPDPDYKSDDTQTLAGAITFGRYCSHCHGGNAVSVGNAPDLRRSPVPLSAEAFTQVVRNGALLERGMPQYAEFDAATLEAVRQYLRSRAAELRAGR